MKHLAVRAFTLFGCFSTLFAIPLQVNASAFQLWEQDGASIANYHAGYAALATDASIAWYNPAGMTRIKNQQLVLGGAAVLTSFKYRGSVTVQQSIFDMVFEETHNDITAQGGNFSFLPNLHYVAPISDCVSFGFSITVPFGLKTDYGDDTPLRYAATLTALSVVNFSPSLAVQLTDQLSVGAGVDFQKADGEFDNVAVSVVMPDTDSTSTNRLNGTAYGFHAGVLYQFTPCSRAGLSYHSKVRHHLTGTSKMVGPIAEGINNFEPIVSERANTNLTLPPYTALSYYQAVTPQIALMGTLIYTQWNTIQALTLNNYAGPTTADILAEPSTDIQITLPKHFRNTWNISLGADYHVNDQIILRAGIGYDQTPVRDQYRDVQLPDKNRYVIAVGGHYQATCALGFDLGWLHVFSDQARVNPPPQPLGPEVVITNGNVKGGADVFGAQLTWNI